MYILKKWALSVSVAVSAMTFAQQSVQLASYPTMYENQLANQTPAAPEKILSAKELFDINVNTLMTDPVLKNAHWGYVIYDPKTKKVVSSYNETDAFIPASTTKLLSTETALSLLGSKFRWVTQLEYSGELTEEGILNGNLYIIGSGDPSLGTGKAGSARYSEIILQYISAMREKGIKRVTGDIIIQNAVFKENAAVSLPPNIVWEPKNNYYLPVGTTRDIDPRNEQLIVKKKGLEGATKEFYYISPYINKLVYTDKFENTALTTRLPDLPSYLATNLRATMLKSGVPISGKVVSKTTESIPERTFLLSAYRSPFLSEIVSDTNHRSDNALAEAILRMVGFQKKGDQTSESGRTVVVDHLKDIGFDMTGFNFADGSGLSRANTVSPISHAKYLAGLMTTKHYKDFFESLPTSGQSGTLKRSFMGNAYGQINAKTGTLSKVKTLAGYLKTRGGKTYTFSLLINNYGGSVDQVKRKMEQLLDPAIDL